MIVGFISASLLVAGAMFPRTTELGTEGAPFWAVAPTLVITGIAALFPVLRVRYPALGRRISPKQMFQFLDGYIKGGLVCLIIAGTLAAVIFAFLFIGAMVVGVSSILH